MINDHLLITLAPKPGRRSPTWTVYEEPTLAALAYSVPDDVESAYAALEVARLRRVWGPRLRIHLDLAGRAAVAETVAAMPGTASPRRLCETLSPLVVEPDGWCGPLEYGFPRDFGLGDVRSTPLPELARAWAEKVYPPLPSRRRRLAAAADIHAARPSPTGTPPSRPPPSEPPLPSVA